MGFNTEGADTTPPTQTELAQHNESTNYMDKNSVDIRNDDFLSRRFNFEGKEKFPWSGPEGYTPQEDGNYTSSWGRSFTPHAVASTFPRNFDPGENSEFNSRQYRSVPPKWVEHTIAYGEKTLYGNPNVGHNRVNGDVIVGVSGDERTVLHVNPWGNKPK
jgi:hypothetical protein